MREQLTFAVDANGLSYYVGVSDKLKHLLSMAEEGANINDWPGDFPDKLMPGFYSATLDVTGGTDSPELHWSSILKLTAIPPWAKVTRLPEAENREKKTRQKAGPKELLEPQVRIRRKGEVLI